MPTYTIRDTKEDQEWEVNCKWAELQDILDANPNWITVIRKAPMIAHETGSRLKVDDGYREVVSKIKDKYKVNNIKDH